MIYVLHASVEDPDQKRRGCQMNFVSLQIMTCYCFCSTRNKFQSAEIMCHENLAQISFKCEYMSVKIQMLFVPVGHLCDITHYCAGLRVSSLFMHAYHMRSWNFTCSHAVVSVSRLLRWCIVSSRATIHRGA